MCILMNQFFICFIYCIYMFVWSVADNKYDVIFKTGEQENAGTHGEVYLKIYDKKGLQSKVKIPATTFLSSSSKKMKFGIKKEIGPITKIQLLHKSTQKNLSWYLKENIAEKIEKQALTSANVDNVIKGHLIVVQVCESGVLPFLRSCVFPIEKWLNHTTNALEAEKKETRDCGVANIERITKETADKNAWPWQATIKVLQNERPHHCSGTLIHRQWIITAAHCFKDDNKPTSYHVTLGDHDLTTKEYTEQDFKVKEIIPHPKHDNSHSLYNLALVKLVQPAILNNRVKIICLPDEDTLNGTGENCFSTGWEDRKNNKGPPNILKQTSFIPSNMSYCKKIWQKTSSRKTLTELSKKFICARHQDEPYCHDDSGGPLACRGLINRFRLLGLDILEKQNCKNPRKYTMFVRVAEHLKWIEKNIYSKYIHLKSSVK